MKTKSLIIFDFDGTICDSLPAYLKLIHRIQEEFSIPSSRLPAVETDDDLRVLKSKTWEQILKSLGLGLKDLPRLMMMARQEIKKEIPHLKFIPAMEESLNLLHEKGHTLGILTSNLKENVENFLGEHNLPLFSFIQGGSSLFGKGHRLKGILKKFHRSILNQPIPRPVQGFYIGDELRDIEAAKSAGLSAVAVTWGMNTKNVLQRGSPDHVLEDPKELLTLFS